MLLVLVIINCDYCEFFDALQIRCTASVARLSSVVRLSVKDVLWLNGKR